MNGRFIDDPNVLQVVKCEDFECIFQPREKWGPVRVNSHRPNRVIKELRDSDY